MAAIQTPLDDLLAYELACSRSEFELLADDEIVGLLTARFRLLSDHGWDWASALLLAADVERPASEAAHLAPLVPTALVLQ